MRVLLSHGRSRHFMRERGRELYSLEIWEMVTECGCSVFGEKVHIPMCGCSVFGEQVHIPVCGCSVFGEQVHIPMCEYDLTNISIDKLDLPCPLHPNSWHLCFFSFFVWLHCLFQLSYTLFFWTLSNISNDTTIPHISSFHHQVNIKQSTVIHFIIGKTFIRCNHGGNAKPSTTPTDPVSKQMLKPMKFSCSLFNNNKINRIWVATEWNHERTQSRWCSLSLNKQKL